MNNSGAAKTDFSIVDVSTIVRNSGGGKTAWLGITEWGTPNKPTEIGSWDEYRANFGGLLTEDTFPLYCKLALELGAKLVINKISHYADPTDASTLVGVKATATLTVSANSAVFTASNIGAWGNKITVTSVVAVSGIANAVDITVAIAGNTDLTKTYYSIPNAPSSDEKATLNARMKYVQLGTVTNLIPVGTVTLSTGAPTNSSMVSSIVEADYIGDSGAATGLHALDAYSNFMRVSIPSKATSTMDDAVRDYVIARKDIIGIIRTPIGLDGDTCVEYRQRTGSYSGTPIDDWRMFGFTGGWIVSHPTTGADTEVPETVALAGVMSQRDENNPAWFSFSGPKRGRVQKGKNVVMNFGTPARQTTMDTLVNNGINPLINDTEYGMVFWGNATMQRADTLLKKTEVAELLMYVMRVLRPVVRFESFDPNDVSTWKAIYLRVKPVMDAIKAERGVWDYVYLGDQDVSDVSQATVNTPDNIDSGAYKFRLYLKPKVVLLYIGVEIGVTNSGFDFKVIEGQPA